MKLSTRNQLPGTVTSVTVGEAMAVVKDTLDDGPEITSSITRDAAEELGLAEGSKVVALVKSTEVAPRRRVSRRSQRMWPHLTYPRGRKGQIAEPRTLGKTALAPVVPRE